jgi:hypothetical protein
MTELSPAAAAVFAAYCYSKIPMTGSNRLAAALRALAVASMALTPSARTC